MKSPWKPLTPLLGLLLLLPGPASLPAQQTSSPAEDSPPGDAASASAPTAAHTELEQQFRETYQTEIGEAYRNALFALDVKYAEAVDRALQAATKSGKSAEAVFIRDEIQRLQDGGPLPPSGADTGIPASLAALRATYREELTRLITARDEATAPLLERYREALAARQETLTNAGGLDAALALKAYRETGLAEKITGEPALTIAPAPQAQPQSPGSPGAPGSQSDEHTRAALELIQWAAAAKYRVVIDVDGKPRNLPISGALNPYDVPATGDFKLISILHQNGTTVAATTPFPWHALTGVPEIESLTTIRPVEPVTAAHLACLGSLPALKVFDTKGARFTADAIHGLPSLPALETFQVDSGQDFQPGWIPVLRAKCPHLKKLTLSLTGDHEWTSAEYREIARWPDLEFLALHGKGTLNQDFTAAFAGHQHLRHLMFYRAWTSDPATIARLAEWPALESIHLRSRPLLPLLPEILKLPNLKSLNLTFGSARDEDLAIIGAHARPTLQRLYLAGNGAITDQGLVHLHYLTQLNEMTYGQPRGVTPEGIARLKEKLPDCKINQW